MWRLALLASLAAAESAVEAVLAVLDQDADGALTLPETRGLLPHRFRLADSDSDAQLRGQTELALWLRPVLLLAPPEARSWAQQQVERLTRLKPAKPSNESEPAPEPRSQTWMAMCLRTSREDICRANAPKEEADPRQIVPGRLSAKAPSSRAVASLAESLEEPSDAQLFWAELSKLPRRPPPVLAGAASI
jgi:hypothetical protein